MNSIVKVLFVLILSLAFNLATGPLPILGQNLCQTAAGGNTTTSSLTISDAPQTGIIVRDGRPSTCRGKTNTLQNAIVVRAKQFFFTSPVTGCATVDFDHTGCGGNSTANVAYSTYNPGTPNTGVIGDSGVSSIGRGSYSFPVNALQTYSIVVHEISANSGCPSFSFTISYRTGCRAPGFDSTNDGKADVTVFRPGTNLWYTLGSAGGVKTENFGLLGDTVTAGDYTGDGVTDVSVYRASSNFWYYANSHTDPGHNFTSVKWGAAGDTPVPGDYDRDGKTDIAVWRPSNGTWYILRSSDATVQTGVWGLSGDRPMIGDFDGDLAADLAVFRPNDASVGGASQVYILESDFQQAFFLRFAYGLASDIVVPADYDGDGKTDVAVFRPSTGVWYINQSSVTSGDPSRAITWGISTDIPQPADYDGDKKADIAVFRSSATPSRNVWYILNSSTGTASAIQWGLQGDQPATAAYQITNP